MNRLGKETSQGLREAFGAFFGIWLRMNVYLQRIIIFAYLNCLLCYDTIYK